MTDLKFALRQLLKSPGFTAVVVLSLALGIGATTTVVGWMRHFLFRPLVGVPAQQQLVVLQSNTGGGNVSLPDVEDFRKLDAIFSGILLSQKSSASLKVDDQTTWVEAQIVSADFFDVLGVRPILGRGFLPGEDRKPGGDPVVLISERLWRNRFAADPAILGRVVELNRYKFTIVGVAPAEFRGSECFESRDLWAPISMQWEVRNQLPMMTRNARGWHNLARLRPGVTPAQAQAAVDALDSEFARNHPETNREIRHRVRTSVQQAGDLGAMFSVLLAVTLGVLLIVIANVANLLLARAATRQKEIAVRVAAGASRGQLIRQLLAESLLLALPGGVAGVVLARWMIDAFPLFLPGPLAARVFLEISLDAPTLVFALLLTIGTGVAFGLVPALKASRLNLNEALKAGGRSAAAPAHHRVRNTLVVVEVGLAVVLLVCAGLLIKGSRAARQIDIGFQPEPVLAARLQIGMNGYDQNTAPAFYRRLRQRLADLPGVEEAALASWFPLGLQGCKGSGVHVDGYDRPAGEDTAYEYAIVSQRYFATLQIPIVAGREFTAADDDKAPLVAVVNEHFARRFWPGREAVGQRFRCFGQWRTVVGVAKAGKYNRLDEPPWCFYYLPDQQGVPELDLNLCVRAQGDPAAFAGALRNAVHELDPGVELLETFPLRDHVRAVLVVENIASSLLTLLGAAALLLAAMGVYAVMAFSVSQQTKEFGVRMALGAQATDVLRQVLLDGLLLTAIGAFAGLGLALGVTRLLTGFLYGVSPFDVATFVGVPALLAAVALLACYLPARRATRVNPVEALRAE